MKDTSAPQVLTPPFLDQRDDPWLKELVSEYDRFSGSTVRELKRRLQEPLACYCPRKKLPYAVAALDAIYKPAVAHPKKLIAEVRWRAFTGSEAAPWQASALSDVDSTINARRQPIAAAVMEEVKHGGASFDDLLFADLPNERRVGEPPQEVSITELRLLANSHLTRSILLKSRKVRIEVTGNETCLAVVTCGTERSSQVRHLLVVHCRKRLHLCCLHSLMLESRKLGVTTQRRRHCVK